MRARAVISDPRFLLGAIVLTALALRLVDAGNRLSHDEGYSYLVAAAGTPSEFLRRLAAFENTPPLFYMLLGSLPLSSEFWLRVLSIIAGTAQVPILYAIVRPLLGVRAALLAALGLAVAPFAVSYSDYARGFMVAGVGILLALLAAQRLAAGARRRWWWLYAVAGTWALYSEYYTGLYLLGMVVALLVLGTPRRRDTVAFGAAPLVAFLPWIPQMTRSINDLGRTKLEFVAHGPSPHLIRDALVPLFFGEHGSAGSTALRSAQAVVVIAVISYACVRLRRTSPRAAFWLLAGVMIIALCLHLLLTATVTEIFAKRYLTTVIALSAAVLAGTIVSLPWRRATTAAAVVLAALGVAIVLVRAGRQYEPDTPGAVQIARVHGFRTVLTNSAVVVFYGRDLVVVLDRPFGLGGGFERYCAPRCAVIDDARFAGVRPGPGPRIDVGPIVVRFPPREQ